MKASVLDNVRKLLGTHNVPTHADLIVPCKAACCAASSRACDTSVGILIGVFFKKISEAHIAHPWLDKCFALARIRGDPAAASTPPAR